MRLPVRDGGLLEVGRSCPSIDNAAGESGIFGGRGGDIVLTFCIVGQYLGDGMISDGYLFCLLGDLGPSAEETEPVLIEVITDGAISEPESSSETSYISSKSSERRRPLQYEEVEDVNDGTGDVDSIDRGALMDFDLPRPSCSPSSSLQQPPLSLFSSSIIVLRTCLRASRTGIS